MKETRTKRKYTRRVKGPALVNVSDKRADLPAEPSNGGGAIAVEATEVRSSPISETALVRRSEERSVSEVMEQSNKIQELMKMALREGQHYGVIPGTKKQSLLKPGAEKINFLFRIGTGDLQETRTDLPDGHREVTIKTPMIHIPTGTLLAYGIGSCSTMESKYRYRTASRNCPRCGKETIIKGKDEYGGGWLCYVKKGGCGAKFRDGDTSIEGQAVGQIENKDIADVYNTVLKMAAKRSYVDGTIKASAASDFFTQDVEDMEDGNGHTPDPTWTPEAEDKPVERAPASSPPATPTGKPAHTLGDRLTTLIMSPLLSEAERAEIRTDYRGKCTTDKQRGDYLATWEEDIAERANTPARDDLTVTLADGTKKEVPF